MLNYPPVLTETCKYCGAVVTLVRQGDGQPFHGKLHYWYSTDHHCSASDQAIAAQGAEHELLVHALYSGSPLAEKP